MSNCYDRTPGSWKYQFVLSETLKFIFPYPWAKVATNKIITIWK